MTGPLRFGAAVAALLLGTVPACASEDLERVGMVRLGPVPTASLPEPTPAVATTSTVPPPAATTAAPTTTWAPSTTAAPTPDTPFTVATSNVDLLETFRSPEATDPWWLLPDPASLGGPRVLLVRGQVAEMLEVDLPVRPNGSTGFVRSSDVTLSRHRARVVVELGSHRVWAWEDGELVAEGSVALGADGTPTPVGEFYITEMEAREDPDTLFGAWVIGTSGFSEALPLVDGMDPAVALHGTNEPELLGSDVSEGCIRMHDDVAARIAALPLGTPVEIRA